MSECEAWAVPMGLGRKARAFGSLLASPIEVVADILPAHDICETGRNVKGQRLQFAAFFASVFMNEFGEFCDEHNCLHPPVSG